jgi:hypothetical protein
MVVRRGAKDFIRCRVIEIVIFLDTLGGREFPTVRSWPHPRGSRAGEGLSGFRKDRGATVWPDLADAGGLTGF